MKILWRSVTQGLELYWTRWRDLRGLSEYSVRCSLYSCLTVPLSDRSHLHRAHQTFLYQSIIRRCHDNASIRYVEILTCYRISLRSQYVVKKLMTIDISGSFLQTAVSLTEWTSGSSTERRLRACVEQNVEDLTIILKLLDQYRSFKYNVDGVHKWESTS